MSEARNLEVVRELTQRWKSGDFDGLLDRTMPFSIVFTLRDGKITGLEWFTDHDSAVTAVRDA